MELWRLKMAINESKLKELLHGIREVLGSVLNSTEAEVKKAIDMVEGVFEPEPVEPEPAESKL